MLGTIFIDEEHGVGKTTLYTLLHDGRDSRFDSCPRRQR